MAQELPKLTGQQFDPTPTPSKQFFKYMMNFSTQQKGPSYCLHYKRTLPWVCEKNIVGNSTLWR